MGKSLDDKYARRQLLRGSATASIALLKDRTSLMARASHRDAAPPRMNVARQCGAG